MLKLKYRNRGSSLIEVLVAMVVLSFGLLAFAVLQISGIISNSTAQQRSQATILAYGIIDSMRANLKVAKAAGYDRAASDAIPTDTATAAVDVKNWLTDVAARLPSGKGAISTNGGVTTVSLSWDDSRGKSASSTAVFSVRARL